MWDALEAVLENEVSNLPVNVTLSDVLDNWINKEGFPVVTVSLVDGDVVISQVNLLKNYSDWYLVIQILAKILTQRKR